jgi:PadR family transcriptional regulator PadR
MDDRGSSILAGTLDLLILKILSVGVLHGYAIAQNIARLSKESLRVEEGSLYPALQRMQVKGWITSESKKTPTGRKARYYRLTTAGRRQLVAEEKSFEQSVAATMRVLRAAESCSSASLLADSLRGSGARSWIAS